MKSHLKWKVDVEIKNCQLSIFEKYCSEVGFFATQGWMA